jgi:hypothetical protein
MTVKQLFQRLVFFVKSWKKSHSVVLTGWHQTACACMHVKGWCSLFRAGTHHILFFLRAGNCVRQRLVLFVKSWQTSNSILTGWQSNNHASKFGALGSELANTTFGSSNRVIKINYGQITFIVHCNISYFTTPVSAEIKVLQHTVKSHYELYQ